MKDVAPRDFSIQHEDPGRQLVDVLVLDDDVALRETCQWAESYRRCYLATLEQLRDAQLEIARLRARLADARGRA
ncbi:MAG TPA: hypothetical protein VLT86_13005 [Vicinamibacterales bacterium]|nr:hypothetical protein [Vicinamibacterales bacterium]